MLDLTGYKLTFDDEFNTRSISQTGAGTTWADIRSQWRFDANSDIGFGHSSFVDPASGYDPFKVQGGVLTITAVADKTASGYSGSWESGLINTQGNFSQTYGYFEMRADLSDAKGAWDAFWLLPDKAAANPNHLSGWQELDVVEHYGGNDKGVYSTIHTTDQTPNIPWQQNRQVYSETAQASGYHTYGMDWQKDKISFYVDGKFVGSQATPSDMTGPMYLVANLATQNDADAAGVPITTKIDYIRAYSNNPNAVAVTQDPVSAPDGQDPGLYGATSTNHPLPSKADSTPTSTSIGSGSDQLIFKISEDAYKGDALYTVSVDGKQIGGTLTAHASHTAGQSDTVTVNGDWAAGDHKVSINFLNDTYDGTASTDRNLYIDSATYDGTAVSGSHLSLMSAGAQIVTVHDTTAVPTPAAPVSTLVSTPTSTSIGSGSDQLIFKISEDAYKGDALYTVSVDGKQIGGTLTAHASHTAGQSDTVTVNGDWAAGDHKVSINFLNDTYDGTASTDRNLYIDSATYDGTAVSGSHLSLMSAGAQIVTVHDTTAVPTPAAPVSTLVSTPTSTSIGSGSDQLIFKISEDAYKGDALYTVSVDGKQIGGTLTAHASHTAGQSDTVTVNGDWAAGDHKVNINFLNDAYDGTASTDRNLYIDSATYDGAAVSGSHLSLMSAGAQIVTVHDYGLL
ncbi:carbohydrate-binding domain-containing protein [Methylobacterium sp. WL30]|nr:carbohydrate-binding domain-containing protein [Methylobacterium sp. WL30]